MTMEFIKILGFATAIFVLMIVMFLLCVGLFEFADRYKIPTGKHLAIAVTVVLAGCIVWDVGAYLLRD